MAEINGVRDKDGFSCGVYYLEAAVVLQVRADVEAVTGAEGPGGAGGWLVVDEYVASDGAEGVGVEIEGAIEVFPSGSGGGDSGLAEKVEGELGFAGEVCPINILGMREGCWRGC